VAKSSPADSQGEDRVPSRIQALSEGTEDRSSIAIKTAERRTGRRERRPIAPGVGDEQQNPIESAVAPLQLEPALDRLNVFEDGLGLDPDRPTRAADNRVPGTTITFDREWNLRPPSKVRVDASSKPAEEALLRGVPDGISRGKRSHSELETNGCRDAGDRPEIGLPDPTGFDPGDGGAFDAARRTHSVATQSGGASGGSQLESHPMKVLIHPLRGEVHRSGSRCHWREHAGSGSPDNQTTAGRSCRTDRANRHPERSQPRLPGWI
jgi:hypothetical protein